MKKVRSQFFYRLALLSIVFFSVAPPFVVSAADAPVTKKQIAEACTENSECVTDNCQQSVKTKNNAFLKVCACKKNQHCVDRYEPSASPDDWSCVTGIAGTWAVNYCHKQSNQFSDQKLNIRAPLDYTSPGVLNAIFHPEASIEAKASEIRQILDKPQLSINIPGVKFTDMADLTKKWEEGRRYVYVPFIGEYFKAVYQYIIIAASVISVVVLIVAGTRWTLSGGSTEVIMESKKQIVGAIIGLVIALTSYTLLYTINPELVQFRSLRIQDLGAKPNEGLDDHYKVNLKKKCDKSDPGLISFKCKTIRVKGGKIIDWKSCEEAAKALEPIKVVKEIWNDKDATFDRRWRVDCSQFADCSKGRWSCLNACVAQRPPKKASRTYPYNQGYLGVSKSWWGIMDCNAVSDGKRRTASNIHTLALHEGNVSGGVPHWWSGMVRDGNTVASHYFITRGGGIVMVMDELFQAAHIATSPWNIYSIGVDLDQDCLSNGEIARLKKTPGIISPPNKRSTCWYTNKMYEAIGRLYNQAKGRGVGLRGTMPHCHVQGNRSDPRNIIYSKINANGAPVKDKKGNTPSTLTINTMTGCPGSVTANGKFDPLGVTYFEMGIYSCCIQKSTQKKFQTVTSRSYYSERGKYPVVRGGKKGNLSAKVLSKCIDLGAKLTPPIPSTDIEQKVEACSPVNLK
ncbi:MAG: hypothetical protein ABII02_01575 [Candidatus Magasanikbacteria bacterium]